MTSRVTAERIPAERPRSLGVARYAADGRALDSAIDLAGSCAKVVAESWGCDAETVHEVRRGGKPLSWQRVQRLPAAVRLALLEPEIARCRATDRPSDLALIAAVTDNETGREIAKAAADGRWDASEMPAIEAAMVRDAADLQAARVLVDEVNRERVLAVRIVRP